MVRKYTIKTEDIPEESNLRNDSEGTPPCFRIDLTADTTETLPTVLGRINSWPGCLSFR